MSHKHIYDEYGFCFECDKPEPPGQSFENWWVRTNYSECGCWVSKWKGLARRAFDKGREYERKKLQR